MMGAIRHYIEGLNQLGGLSDTDIANITGMSKGIVLRWKSGALNPQPSVQLVLSRLYYVISRLQEYYLASEIRAWLYARHSQLNGMRAIDLIDDNRTEEILPVLDRLDAEVYL